MTRDEFNKASFMPADDGWTTVTASATAPAATAGWAGRPQLSVIDILLLVWRAKWTVIIVALPILIASIAVAMTMPVKYQATSRIQVTAGSERVFDPIVGGVQASVLGQEEITESEVELLYSPVIADRVIQTLGLEVIYPKAYAAIMKAPLADRPVMYEQAVNSLQQDFYAGASPKNPVIRTGFKHENPVVAADVLNTIIDTYLSYRAELFSKDDKGFLANQRTLSLGKLSEADVAIEHFLTLNRIGDFDSEKASITALYGSVTDDLFKVQAQKSEVDGRLAMTSAQLSMTEPTIDLYIDTNYQQQLFDLKAERTQLMSSYKPGTPQVEAIERRIASMQALINSDGKGAGQIRRGPNDLFQTLAGRRSELESESAALKKRFEELQRQKSQIEKRQLELTRLEPDYQDLLRNRAILEEQVRSLTVREEEERLKREVARVDLENIQILEPARPPAKGKSMKKLVVGGGLLLGLGTGLMFALVWVFTRSTLPTAGSVSRTTGLPVLASVRPVK